MLCLVCETTLRRKWISLDFVASTRAAKTDLFTFSEREPFGFKRWHALILYLYIYFLLVLVILEVIHRITVM